ncbi:hypothetical protein AS29_005770 [Bacillus sp. SJS]|nr:hypothetical protein AS29_005770 [Bacillus sp. SJS]
MTPVDWSGRRETPAGAAGQVRPRSGAARRRLTARPAESESLQRKSTAKFNRANYSETRPKKLLLPLSFQLKKDEKGTFHPY